MNNIIDHMTDADIWRHIHAIRRRRRTRRGLPKWLENEVAEMPDETTYEADPENY